MSYFLYAEVLKLHRRELLAEAERDRLGDEARRGGQVDSLRVRFGRLLHNSRAPRFALPRRLTDFRRTRASTG